jgi:hypothetical protein
VTNQLQFVVIIIIISSSHLQVSRNSRRYLYSCFALLREYYIDASRNSGWTVIRRGTFVVVLLWYFEVISGNTNIIQVNTGGLLAANDLGVAETKTSVNKHNSGRNRNTKISRLTLRK